MYVYRDYTCVCSVVNPDSDDGGVNQLLFHMNAPMHQLISFQVSPHHVYISNIIHPPNNNGGEFVGKGVHFYEMISIEIISLLANSNPANYKRLRKLYTRYMDLFWTLLIDAGCGIDSIVSITHPRRLFCPCFLCQKRGARRGVFAFKQFCEVSSYIPPLALSSL